MTSTPACARRPAIRLSCRHWAFSVIVGLIVGGMPPSVSNAQTTRDSAGVRVLENRRQPGQLIIRIEDQPLIQIGSVDGSNATDFSSILAARFLPTGHIAAVDLHVPEIRVFDNQGMYIRTIGRSGSGPGEFKAAPVISPSDDGGIWAWDPGTRRLSLFTVDGRLRSERFFSAAEMKGVPNAFTLNAWQVSHSGVVISTAGRVRRTRRGFATEREILVINDRNTAPTRIGSVSTAEHPTDGGFYAEDPFKSPNAVAVVGDRVFVSGAGSWELKIYDIRGRLIEIVRSAIPRKLITSELIRRERARIQESSGGNPAFARLFDELQHTDSTSAINVIKSSSDGTIWVARWHSRLDTGLRVYDVLDHAGVWVATVQMPANSGDVADISADRVLTIWSDEYNIPYLRVYRITR